MAMWLKVTFGSRVSYGFPLYCRLPPADTALEITAYRAARSTRLKYGLEVWFTLPQADLALLIVTSAN